jgi:hypothetical protein
MSPTFVIAGFAMAFFGMLFGATGLFWILWASLARRRAAKRTNKVRRSLIVELEDKTQRKVIDERAVMVINAFIEMPELVDDKVRGAISALIALDFGTNNSIFMIQFVQKMTLLMSKVEDVSIACDAIMRMWNSDGRSIFEKRISDLAGAVEIYLHAQLRASKTIDSRSLVACELMVAKCEGLPHRHQIMRHLEGLRGLLTAWQAAAFRKDLG